MYVCVHKCVWCRVQCADYSWSHCWSYSPVSKCSMRDIFGKSCNHSLFFVVVFLSGSNKYFGKTNPNCHSVYACIDYVTTAAT